VPTKIRAVAFNNRGNVCFNIRNYQRAVAYYTEAIKLDGGNANFVLNRRLVYVRRPPAC
jgi:tetratricopeptide (TPR) repeat protein